MKRPDIPGTGLIVVSSLLVKMQPRSSSRARHLDWKNRWRILKWLIKSLL
jgi:hypothetical protein